MNELVNNNARSTDYADVAARIAAAAALAMGAGVPFRLIDAGEERVNGERAGFFTVKYDGVNLDDADDSDPIWDKVEVIEGALGAGDIYDARGIGTDATRYEVV